MMRKLRYYASFFLVIALVFSLAVIVEERYATSRERDLYPKGMTVEAFDRENDLVIASDWTGHLWGFYGCEDLLVGDVIAAIMDSRGTPEIYDDVVMEIRCVY